MGFKAWLNKRARRAVMWYGRRFHSLPRVEGPVLGLFCDFEGAHAGADGERYSESGLRRLLEILGEYRLPITFNIVADLCRTRPEQVQRIAQAGHEIACHGWRHERPRDLRRADLDAMLARANECFASLGVRPSGFRSPQSAWSLVLLRRLPAHGYHWNAERDPAAGPYRIRPDLVRIGVFSDDWDLADGSGDARSIFAKWQDAVGTALSERRVVCLGTHEWIIGRNEEFASCLPGFIARITSTPQLAVRTLGSIAGCEQNQ